MTEQEQRDFDEAQARYRFSGYQLNLIQLDETGPAYVLVKTSVIDQPTYWSTRGIQIKNDS